MSYFRFIKQDVVADANNSSDVALTGNQTYEGTASSTLGVAGIQVSMKASQDCTVYIEQSPDGSNWDIVDSYSYKYILGGNAWTIQAVNSFYRVRVTNLSASNMTYFRLQTALCPMVEAVPRTLTQEGRFKTESYLTDAYGFGIENTPMGEMRVATIVKLVGSGFRGATVDPNFSLTSVANSGTVTQANSELTVATNTTANGSAMYYSKRAGRYSSGASNRFRMVATLNNTGSVDNIRRWGLGNSSTTMPTISDGAYFELDDDVFSVVILKGGVPTRISNGAFNGTFGTSYVLSATVKTWEIYWTNSKVWFVLGDEVLHMHTGSSESWANTNSFYTFADSINTNNSTTNNKITLRAVSISRFGQLQNQPTSLYVTGLGTHICKYSAGNLNSVTISNTGQNSALTLYDNYAASGTIIWASGAINSSALMNLDFKGLPFNNGLTLVVSGTACNVLLVYE
jgi:hypothetical protein